MKKTVYLPTRAGHYKDVSIPVYLEDVLFERRWGKEKLRIVEVGHYWYRIHGWNYSRRAYGIEKDIELLKRFLDRFATFDDGSRLETITQVRFHKAPKNYYVTFKMVDPYAQALESAGLIQMKER